MRKDFFEIIVGFFTKKEATSPKRKSKKKTSVKKKKTQKDCPITKSCLPGRDGIVKKDNLIQSIIAYIQVQLKNYRGEHYSIKDKALSIYITESLLYDVINKSDNGSTFEDLLIAEIDQELGETFKRVNLELASLPLGNGAIQLFSEVYVSIMPVTKAIQRAVVLPVEHYGSTLDAEYYLDSEEITQLPNCRYNIGAGKYPRATDGSHRENYIAIDDAPNSSEYDKNKYVSHAHANISFSEEFGFMLNVEPRGMRMAGKRTHIYRGNEKIELNNTLIPVPLRHGDYIVLSKYVHLLFKEV